MTICSQFISVFTEAEKFDPISSLQQNAKQGNCWLQPSFQKKKAKPFKDSLSTLDKIYLLPYFKIWLDTWNKITRKQLKVCLLKCNLSQASQLQLWLRQGNTRKKVHLRNSSATATPTGVCWLWASPVFSTKARTEQQDSCLAKCGEKSLCTACQGQPPIQRGQLHGCTWWCQGCSSSKAWKKKFALWALAETYKRASEESRRKKLS